MARASRAVHAKKKHREVLDRAKGFRGARSRRYKAAKEAVMHAERYAYRDRRRKKGEFRRLWITRINAAARQEGLSYSRLMHGLKLAEVEVDRKVLADLAVRDAATFGQLVATAKAALDGSGSGSASRPVEDGSSSASRQVEDGGPRGDGGRGE